MCCGDDDDLYLVAYQRTAAHTVKCICLLRLGPDRAKRKYRNYCTCIYSIKWTALVRFSDLNTNQTCNGDERTCICFLFMIVKIYKQKKHMECTVWCSASRILVLPF